MRENKANSWILSMLPFLSLTLLFSTVMFFYHFMNNKGDLVIWMAERRTPEWNFVFKWITRLGEEHIYLLGILIALFFSYRKSALFSVIGVLSLVLSFIAKSIFSQPRPLAYFNNLGTPELLGNIPDYSFHVGLTSLPSGHTLAAFAFFMGIAFLLKKWYWQVLTAFLAMSVGISRIYLGQHFSLDVALGSLFGVLIAIASYYLVFIVWADKENLNRSFIRP